MSSIGWTITRAMMQEDLREGIAEMIVCTCVDEPVCPLHGDVADVDWSTDAVAWKRSKWMRRQPFAVQWGRQLASYHRPPCWWMGYIQPLQCEDLLRPGYRVGYMRHWDSPAFKDCAGQRDYVIGFAYPRWLSYLIQGWYGCRRWWLVGRGWGIDIGYQKSWREYFERETREAINGPA